MKYSDVLLRIIYVFSSFVFEAMDSKVEIIKLQVAATIEIDNRSKREQMKNENA